MKSIFTVALAACALSLTACGDNQSETTTTLATDTMSTTSMETSTVPPTTTTTTTTTHTPTEGDVSYNGGRVQVYRSNTWSDANEDVRLDNGIVVNRTNGYVTRDGVEYELEDGYVVDRDGNVWDRTGNAVSDAWDATKHGVKRAGKAVGNAAQKVGEKAKDAVD